MNPEKLPSAENIENTARKIGEMALNDRLQDLEFWGDYCYDLEKDFKEEVKNDTMSANKFKKYFESDIENAYRKFFNAEQDLEVAPFSKKGAELELNFQKNLKPEETIEAYSGHFFGTRAIELERKIEETDKEESERVRNLTNDFYEKVLDHIECQYQPTTTAEALRKRMYRHNKIIEGLNNLNSIAKKYGTTPFTPRNFMPCTYETQLNFDSNEEDRAIFDRGVVEAYYHNAFQTDIKKIKREHEYDY